MSIIRKRWQFIVVAVVVLVLAAGWYGGRDTDTDPDELAVSIGATYCDRTSFTIESKLDGETRAVYDCYFADSFKRLCVTESDNIAKDETATVVALFEDTFETNKPACAD